MGQQVQTVYLIYVLLHEVKLFRIYKKIDNDLSTYAIATIILNSSNEIIGICIEREWFQTEQQVLNAGWEISFSASISQLNQLISGLP